MDIINVLSDKLRSKLHRDAFEISSVLATPTEPNALERLEQAIASYSSTISQINTLDEVKEKYQVGAEKLNEN